MVLLNNSGEIDLGIFFSNKSHNVYNEEIRLSQMCVSYLNNTKLQSIKA